MYRLPTIVALVALATVALAAPGSVIPSGELALDIGTPAVMVSTNVDGTVSAQAVRIIDLSDSRLELSALALVSPTATGTGGCASYLIGANTSGTLKVWGDLGIMRLDSETNGLIGLSTTVPFGGVTLTDNARVGIGWAWPYDGPVAYLRTPFSF
jgi:hypothetical protein